MPRAISPSATSQTPSSVASTGSLFSGPVLFEGTAISEDRISFVWKCTPFGSRDIVLEAFTWKAWSSEIGYLLIGGSRNAQWAIYYKSGLDDVWSWGPDADNTPYMLSIRPDGIGAFYNLIGSEGKQSIKPEQTYSCKKIWNR